VRIVSIDKGWKKGGKRKRTKYGGEVKRQGMGKEGSRVESSAKGPE